MKSPLRRSPGRYHRYQMTSAGLEDLAEIRQSVAHLLQLQERNKTTIAIGLKMFPKYNDAFSRYKIAMGMITDALTKLPAIASSAMA